MFLESSPGFQQSMSSDKLSTRLPVIFGILALTLLSAGCASVSNAAPSPSNQSSSANVRVSVTPPSSTVVSGGKQQFAATLTSTGNTAVSWSASAGTISKDGLFVAPTVTSPIKVMITATSAAQLTSLAFSEVTIVPLSKLAIAMNALPAGTADAPYNTSLSANGGSAPYQWAINSGVLPKGLSLDKNSGSISGTPSQVGTFGLAVSVTDATSQKANGSFSLAINTAQVAGTFDGPAELPRVYVQSALADTPAPGSVISVPKGGDFQQALNSATCGDIIELQAGAVFVGNFTIPALACDDAHWIIVRTSAPDSSLPPEGTRICLLRGRSNCFQSRRRHRTMRRVGLCVRNRRG